MKTPKYKRIMMAGPSGIGKTTLAKWLVDEHPSLGYEFVSGSVSDLIPQTKELSHKAMLERDSKTLYMEDYQILDLRRKLFREYQLFVSDRSYLDSLTYFMYKQADKQPSCELEQFSRLCSMILVQQCDLLVVFDFKPGYIDQWLTEDNNKRITNNYFQAEISGIMKVALGIMGYEKIGSYERIPKNLYRFIELTDTVEFGFIESIYGHTDVLIIPSLGLKERQLILEYQLKL